MSLYCIERPAKTSKVKAIPLFLIHGYGSDENDLFSFAEGIPEYYHIISLRAPYPMQPYGNAWYAINFDAEKGKWSDLEQAKASRDLLHHFIQEKCKEKQLDTNKVCVLGFSQGSILSYAWSCEGIFSAQSKGITWSCVPCEAKIVIFLYASMSTLISAKASLI